MLLNMKAVRDFDHTLCVILLCRMCNKFMSLNNYSFGGLGNHRGSSHHRVYN